MINYHIRSRDLLTVVNEVRAGRLILDAYFQRNLVWREAHKQDFIRTILLGYPFPQIFVSKGEIDLEKMETISCVVDGQQRLNAILTFIDGQYAVEGRRFQDLSGDEKSDFLKYEIAVIDLDLSNNDPKVKEIFQRLNRTANSLTAIEKIASQFAPSLYMLVASHLAGELVARGEDEDTQFRVDPQVDPAFFAWAEANPVPHFSGLIQAGQIFQAYEISRKVHLMHVLNIMSAVLTGFSNRNERSRELLETYSHEFAGIESLVTRLESAAEIWQDLNFPPDSYWRNKANFFSLMVALANRIGPDFDLDRAALGQSLLGFAAELPDEYRLAASEAVNNLRQREIRDGFLGRLIDEAARKP